MAKNMIISNKQPRAIHQGGFSMIELLVATFVLAIGILGLAMLQTMALRASKGSGNLGAAVRIAEQVMNQVELEGRLSWLNITDGNQNLSSPGAGLSFEFKYIKMEGAVEPEYFNPRGEPINESDQDDPIAAMKFFTVITEKLPRKNESVGAVGHMSDFNVRVEFTESLGSNKQPITRKFNLTRRIIHG